MKGNFQGSKRNKCVADKLKIEVYHVMKTTGIVYKYKQTDILI